MSLRVGIVALMGGLLLSLAGAQKVRAADQQAMVDQISALTKGAFTAYSDGDLDKAKAQLLQAIAIGKKDSELAVHPLIARTYLLLGVVFIDGFEDHKKGVANFAKALKISPDIEIPEALATKTVKKAFQEAGGSSASPAEAAEPAVADSDSSARAEKDDKPKSARELKQEREQAAREAQEEKTNAAHQTKEERDGDKETARAVLTERKKAEAEARERDQAGREEKAQVEKTLAQVKSTAQKERAERERLQKEKEEKESQIAEAKGVLTEAKGRLQQLEKDKADKDKQIAAGSEREKKEREAKEKLEKDKAEKERLLAEAKQQLADRDKVIAETKQQLQQAQKDKADKDKLIAAGNDRERKEREAKEKLEKDKQASDAREKARRAQEEANRLDREKLAAGPDLPGHIAEAIYCTLPDEVASGTDLFVHCAPGPNVKATELAFYYRASGVAHYNSLLMEKSKKGWYTTVVPGPKVIGRSLQYYVEGRDGRDAVAGANGKAQSPNILTLKAQSALIANGANSGNDGSLTQASSAVTKRAARAGGGRKAR